MLLQRVGTEFVQGKPHVLRRGRIEGDGRTRIADTMLFFIQEASHMAGSKIVKPGAFPIFIRDQVVRV